MTSFQIAETKLHQQLGKLHILRKCHHILQWNLVAPSLQSHISICRLQIPVSHKLTFFCLLSTQSLLESKQWILMLKPNFLVAYSSISFSTHIWMLQELSSFADQFFIISFSQLPSHVEPALVRAPANQKQGGEPRNQSNFTQTAFGFVPKLIFFWNKINIAMK